MTLTTIFRPVVATAALTTVLGFSPLLTAIAQAETLNGAGATFPAPLYERYAREVRKKHPELKVNYLSLIHI